MTMAKTNGVVRTDCFAYKKGKKDGAAICTALKECYCAYGEFCPFYMTVRERREKAARARYSNARKGIEDDAGWEKESRRL